MPRSLRLNSREPHYLAHFSVSLATNCPNWTGVIGIGMPPSSAKRAITLGSASTALISLFFNTGYWATADANNNISPGQPRGTFRLKVTAKL